MGMDENVGSIWGEPRGTTMVDQNLNLEQTNYFHLFIDNKAYPNQKNPMWLILIPINLYN